VEQTTGLSGGIRWRHGSCGDGAAQPRLEACAGWMCGMGGDVKQRGNHWHGVSGDTMTGGKGAGRHR
jgi:hypothetical protein